MHRILLFSADVLDAVCLFVRLLNWNPNEYESFPPRYTHFGSSLPDLNKYGINEEDQYLVAKNSYWWPQTFFFLFQEYSIALRGKLCSLNHGISRMILRSGSMYHQMCGYFHWY